MYVVGCVALVTVCIFNIKNALKPNLYLAKLLIRDPASNGVPRELNDTSQK